MVEDSDYGEISDYGERALAELLNKAEAEKKEQEDEEESSDNDEESDTESSDDDSSETREDRFSLFFQLVPDDQQLEQSPEKLANEYHKFITALKRLQKANTDPRIPSLFKTIETIYNKCVEDLQRAQKHEPKTSDEKLAFVNEPRKSERKKVKTAKAKELAEQAELREAKKKEVKTEEEHSRKSKRAKVKTPKGQALADSVAAATAGTKLSARKRRTPSLPTKATRERVEIYDAKGNKVTGAKFEEEIRKKSEKASFDAQGNAIGTKPPPPPPSPPEDLKPPAVDNPRRKRKKEKNIVTKNGKLKRSVFSRLTAIGCVKDRTVRDKINVCAKQIKQLQYCSTFEDPALREYYPICQHGMFSYDELKQKPHYEVLHKRPEPVFVFLPPEGFDVKTFGKRLQRVGKEMAKASGQGYLIAKDEEEYTNALCGPKMQSKQKKAKSVANL